MTLGRIFGIIVFSSLVTTGAPLAGGISNAAGNKGDHAIAKSGPASIRHIRPEVPIVMGRSVSEHHKTKLHHIKMKPLESIENPGLAGG